MRRLLVPLILLALQSPCYGQHTNETRIRAQRKSNAIAAEYLKELNYWKERREKYEREEKTKYSKYPDNKRLGIPPNMNPQDLKYGYVAKKYGYRSDFPVNQYWNIFFLKGRIADILRSEQSRAWSDRDFKEGLIWEEREFKGYIYIQFKGCKEVEWGARKVKATLYKMGWVPDPSGNTQEMSVVLKRPNNDKFFVVDWWDFSGREREYVSGQILKRTRQCREWEKQQEESWKQQQL